ncbi:MAG TPA: hypothetical protein DCZ01_12870 [Elusimicrobia bacterium]|nr:MAG: hypothetical protein A2X37_09165 [Elusimicrobia bacterium GWA2_66_18]OGR73293.1 MAG: hypothetical protein A2X40_03640 [Elusimicrobia bacterium GWC2_65_9]HAZ09378.1 hypothetical protein [Elusimicrobiota bacterium]
MNALVLSAFFVVCARAEDPAAVVARVLDRLETLMTSQAGKDAREIAEMDRKAETLGREILPLGRHAAAPLGSYARDQKRPPKARLFATVFLGLTRDPGAYSALTALLLDEEQDPEVRSAAAQGLAALDLPLDDKRTNFCGALDRKVLPRDLLEDVLIPVERLGCVDPAPLERIARAFGPRPRDRDLATARRAISALGRSRAEAPARALLRLLAYFPARGAARAAVIAALSAKKTELTGALAAESWPFLREALRSETEEPAGMVALVRLACAYGPLAEDSLLPLAAHPDAEVLAEAAEALARLKSAKALPRLETAVAGAMSDPRFSPKEGRPDPAALLARVEDAVAALRRLPEP